MLGFIKDIIGGGSTRPRKKRTAWKKIGHGYDSIPRWALNQVHEVERKHHNSIPEEGDVLYITLKGRRYRYKIVLLRGYLAQGTRGVLEVRTYRARRRKRGHQ